MKLPDEELRLEEDDEILRLLLLREELLDDRLEDRLEELLDDRFEDRLEELLGRLLDDLDEAVPEDLELLLLAADEEPSLREDREL